MSKAHELGQLGHIVSVSDGISTTVSISGIVSAISFSGDGANLSNTGAIVSAGATVGTQRVALTDITSGIMTSAATDSALVYESSTGTLSATSFSGDGANLSNTGAIVSAGAGTQRVALTDITSGIMTSAATDSALTYDSSTGTLSATAFSGDGSNITNAGATLSATSGTERVVLTNLTSGAMTASSTDSNLTFDASTGTLSATAFSGDGANLSNTGATLSAASGQQKVVLTSLTSGVMTTAATDSALNYNQSNNTLDANITGISSVTAEWTIGADAGNTYYTFSGPGLDGTEQDPNIYLTRGQIYKFTNNMGAHPFRIQSTANGSLGTQYNDGLSTNDVDNGTIEWDVQMDSPSTLYYQCTSHTSMGGAIYIADPNSISVESLSYSTTTNVVETHGNNLARVNGQWTVNSSSASNNMAYNPRLLVKNNYATQYGGQRSSQGVMVIKSVGESNFIIGGYSSMNINHDKYWGAAHNTCLGYNSGLAVDSSDTHNTAIGSNTATATGNSYYKNTAIGSQAGSNGTPSGTGNCTAIGYNAQWGASALNKVVLGDANIATLSCNVQTISSLSDRRDKTNIVDIPVGLNYINALRPVKFDWLRRDGSSEGRKAFGFIAQELNEVQEQFGYKEYTNLVLEQDPDKLEAAPMNSYPILVKAVQELSQQNQDLLRRIEELENRLNNE
jgi:hypothetical protein